MPRKLAQRPSRRGEPAWELLDVLPEQGEWSVIEYLRLCRDSNQQIEFTNGYVEVLPVPEMIHQVVMVWLCNLLNAHRVNGQRSGIAVVSPFIFKVSSKRYRQPDVLFVKHENAHRVSTKRWTYADLLIEIVSEGARSRHRDYERKRKLYARAGVPEYWVVDPIEKAVTVFALESLPSATVPSEPATYCEVGRFGAGQTVASPTVAGLVVSIDELFDRPELRDIAP